MYTVNNVEELENLHSFKNYKIDEKYHPKFPALAFIIRQYNGITGDNYALRIIDIPENFDVKSFVAGVNAESKFYKESIFIKK